MSQTEEKPEEMKALEVEAGHSNDCSVDNGINPKRQRKETPAGAQTTCETKAKCDIN